MIFSWEFLFRMFLKRKSLRGRLDSSIPRPHNDINRVKITQWNSNDAKIISQILSSIDAHIVLNLQSFHYAKDM